MARKSTRHIATAMAVMLAGTEAAAQAVDTPATTVETTEGKLEGQRASGVVSFLGINYGADTGGANRFLPPKAPPSWTGIRKADQMGNRCPQPTSTCRRKWRRCSHSPICR